MTERIDAHHHLWRYSANEYGWITPDMAVLRQDFLLPQLQQAAQTVDVHGTVVVQARQSLEETAWLLDLAAASPLVRGVVGWLPLASDSLPPLLRQFTQQPKLAGLRHVVQDEPDDDFLLREDFNRGVRAMLDTGLVYDILIHERHLPQASAFVRNHPEQVFVLDHLAKPRVREQALQPWLDDLQRLAAHSNVYAKLSGLVTEASWANWTPEQIEPYLDAALRLFGPERLMAGSDWPVCLLAADYARWWTVLKNWTSRLAPSAQEQLLGGTAKRVYRLSS